MSVAPSENFFFEKGEAGAKIKGVHESLLQECEKDIIFFKEHFLGKDHENYLAPESPVGPISVSVILADNTYKAIFRTDKGSERLQCSVSDVPVPWYRRLLGLGPSTNAKLSALSSDIPVQYLKPCKNPNLPNELLTMEERQVIRSYKFGLLYCAPGQSTEREMFNNTHENTSKEFKQFLNLIGEKIELKNWKGYRAGLDVVGNLTGTHSIYTKWQGYEIMLHVSTLLPFNEHENQQLERKRHIGNDILVIIFQDGDSTTPITLDTIDSRQNHVMCIIKPQGDDYLINVGRKKGVPYFTPDLPIPAHMQKDTVSRDFLLHKLVNGERAAYKAPSFAPKIARTRAVLLKEVAQRFVGP
eukprot:Lithocolla_globosa_v1_NODE_5701_length_1199_cov_185.523601.p1 type:complete len:357 gc:universal NODE_5701_length_1199_cov_185.523601:68-1138(+)